MAKFIKHVGKHGDRKVAVIFPQIPNEEHMCLVVYTELLNQNIHDKLMEAIESPQGQQAGVLADELNRSYTKDGRIILQVLHAEGMMKKIQTNQVVMTPAPNQSIRLNELNTILNEMKQGEQAIKRLAEIDASRGLQDPKDVAKRMRGESTVSTNGALGDQDIANNLRQQAEKMRREAQSLLAEAERLTTEADSMVTVVAEVKKSVKKSVSKTEVKSTAKATKTPKTVKAEPVAEIKESKPVKTVKTKKAQPVVEVKPVEVVAVKKTTKKSAVKQAASEKVAEQKPSKTVAKTAPTKSPKSSKGKSAAVVVPQVPVSVQEVLSANSVTTKKTRAKKASVTG